MTWDELVARVMALPTWARASIVAWSARLVEPNFRGWMREPVYLNAIDSALTFAERLIVAGGDIPKAPLRLPEQIALIPAAASAAARATWEDDLDPDAKPSGYASSAYAASEAAAAVSSLLRGIGFGLREDQERDLRASLTSSLDSAKHDATTAGWTPSFDVYKAAEAKGEAAFIVQVADQFRRIEQATASALNASGGIEWKLFCSTDPVAAPLSGDGVHTPVFLSYSHADSRFATKLYQELRRHGVSCWLDEHDMVPGERILDAVDAAIQTSKKVVVICSRPSLESWWVKDELRKAQEQERRKGAPILIPLLLDRFLLDVWKDGLASDLRSRLAADFIDWESSPQRFNAAFAKLYKALKVQ